MAVAQCSENREVNKLQQGSLNFLKSVVYFDYISHMNFQDFLQEQVSGQRRKTIHSYYKLYYFITFFFFLFCFGNALSLTIDKVEAGQAVCLVHLPDHLKYFMQQLLQLVSGGCLEVLNLFLLTGSVMRRGLDVIEILFLRCSTDCILRNLHCSVSAKGGSDAQ